MNIYIGRFQIFHNGHLDALNQVKNLSSNCIIGLGSSQIARPDFKNPFTAKQRAIMIRLIEPNIKIIEIPDFKYDDDWRNYILATVHNLELVFSENDYILNVFPECKKLVKRNLDISTTDIKNRIIENRNWQKLVPPKIYQYIKDNELDKAIKKLGKNQSI